MFARRYAHFGLFGLGQVKYECVVDLLPAVEEVEPDDGLKIRYYSQLLGLDTGFLEGLSKGGLHGFLAVGKMPLGEIPISASAIEQEVFYPVRRPPEDYKSGHYLFF